ncbi:hypothetical protein WR25_10132 isoform B [Diploscapter pachys]|uniref:Uncharacterized protein n=1 Tax=Diploscapter pachys TaxID=2018661 RepID=A0A2A2LF92_9BILA|nr:hypothetical protein WR25_10132 isoform B [Diploscapter pachys]
MNCLFVFQDASHPLNNVPAGAIRQQAAYVPPHLRNKSAAQRAAIMESAAPTAIKPQQNQQTQQVNEKDRKIRQLETKLNDILKLKEKQKKDDILQKNQLEKINKEAELQDELEKLKLLS